MADPGRLGTRAGEREVPQGTAQPDLAEGQAEPKGLRGAGVLGGAPVYTSPAPDLQPEHAPPEKACGIRMQSFDPEKGFRRGSAGSNGLRNAEIDPAATFGKAPGLRKP